MHRTSHAATLALAALLGGSGLAGCHETSTLAPKGAATTSEVSGHAALGSFPKAPATVRAVDRAQHIVEAAVDALGRFHLPVPAGHGWKLELLSQGRSFPIVFPRAEGGVDSEFALGAGRSIDLGWVRFVPDARTEDIHVATADAPKCEHGLDPRTGAICVEDAAEKAADCAPVARRDVPACDGPDCDVPPAAPEPAPSAAAVPEHNVPVLLGCNDAR